MHGRAAGLCPAARPLVDLGVLPVDGPNPHQWSPHFARANGRRHWPCEALVRAISGRHFKSILELGCGDGANLWLLAEHADIVTGIDACDEAVALAADTILRRRVQERVVIMRGDMRALDNFYGTDAVVDVMSSQHLSWDEHVRLYRRLASMLPSGAWFFTYHLAHGTTVTRATKTALFDYGSLPDLFPEAGPICLPTNEALTNLLRTNGLGVKRHENVTRDYGDGRRAVYHAVQAEVL